MAKAAKKTEKVKKPAQSETGGRPEDLTVMDTERRGDAPDERTVILTDSDSLDTQEAGGSGLQGPSAGSGEESQDTDSSVERARQRLAKTKRSKIVSRVSDDEEDEGDKGDREK